ncbi:MAG: hypothetical protein PF503_17035 [Desulfobacula sp.]|jgi:hypothetical protein|nr:hypothetical protein [Desulfobacula sp.]
MNKKSILISTAMSISWIPVTDNTQTFIQSPCPSCNRQMMVFQRSRFEKERTFACICDYRHRMNEGEYEVLTGLCFTCGKEECCANDHRFIGVIPAGMGL